MSNRKVIELLLQSKSAKAHGRTYIKVKPHLVCHLLRIRLLSRSRRARFAYAGMSEITPRNLFEAYWKNITLEPLQHGLHCSEQFKAICDLLLHVICVPDRCQAVSPIHKKVVPCAKFLCTLCNKNLLHYIFIISQLWLTSHPRSTVDLLDTGTPGTSREIYSEDSRMFRND